MDFAVPVDNKVKIKESEKRDKYLDLARELKKKNMGNEGDSDTNCHWCTWDCEAIGRLGNKRTSWDHPDFSIIKIDQNTEESPGDLRRFAASQTPVRNHLINLVWKTLKGVNNNKEQEIIYSLPLSLTHKHTHTHTSIYLSNYLSIRSMTGLEGFKEHQWVRQKEGKRSKLWIENVCLFIFEIFRHLIQMKSIRLLYELFFSWHLK